MIVQGRVRKTYACGSVALTTLLSGCSIALISLVLHWNSFTTDDGNVVRFPVEGLENLKVKRTATLLWSCILVLPLCFTGFFLICFSKRFMALLLILTGILSFASSLYASKNFREIYHKIHIIFEDDDDSFDDRCESKSYNGLEYCVCNIGPLNPPKNATLKLLKFRVDECDELEDVTGKFKLFFFLSLSTSILSAVILFISMMEFCIPLKQMSAVLLQQERAQNYESTKKANHRDKHHHTTGFTNPVVVQCTKTGQTQSVFWYPYTSSSNASTNCSDNTVLLGKDHCHNSVITCSAFKGAKEDIAQPAWARQ